MSTRSTEEAFEELKKSLEALAIAIAEAPPIKHIFKSVPKNITRRVEDDFLVMLMIEFAILWTIAIILADLTMRVLKL